MKLLTTLGFKETCATYSLYPKKSFMDKFREWSDRNLSVICVIVLILCGIILLGIIVMSVGLSATESGMLRNFIIRGI